MKTFKATESDGTIRVYNPRYITHAKLVSSEYNKDWCIVLFTDDQSVGDPTFTMLFNTKEEAQKKFDELISCIESC